MGLLLAACSPLTPSAQGRAYDHFDDPAQSELLWQREVIFGPGGAIFTGGQATLDITPEAARGSSGYQRTLDNFFVTGTHP